MLGLLNDPDVARAVGGFFRRHPIATAVVGGFAGAAAYVALTRRPEPPPPVPLALPRWSSAPASRIPWIPPTPAAIAAHERAVRVWAYQLGQGAAPADVPAHLAADVERYVAAGGRERHGNAEGAFPFDW
ncbi:MAG: hypothetical protein IT338_17440 [Thermomicrobiales bacterium]|nr:hypothetical protein [Thermomicrobiales bacterium]